ncbi:carboxypeptidase-like regulatory domain-containing protein [Roseospirillum parvum]|uniref:carboxypeptidase-like regulatory domain-containing protein n=1 Tax=Roseospirillum parvum TaxID=83401 RepID=UPI001160ABD0|nr:carboxypeptidase-like regulatory domain-containing protein [Roseospirillum parvum]
MPGRPTSVGALLAVLLLVLGAGVAAAEQLAANSSPLPPPGENDLLVMEARLGNYILADSLFAYRYRGGVLLPLSEMMAILEFPIDVNPDAGTAEGWYLAENRRFSLDLGQGFVFIDGRREPLDPAKAIRHDFDIYIDSELMSAWFPVILTANISRLVLKVESEEPLPFEQRLEREKRQARLGQGRGPEGPSYPRIDNPYRVFSWPVADVSLSADWDNDQDRVATSHAVHLAGDMAGFSADIYATGRDKDTLTDIRATLSRQDVDGNLLGIGLSELEIGDVYTPQTTLVASGREGRGVAVSAYPLARRSDFGQVTLRGELKQGWEVELYRNNILIDAQESRGDGRYEFIDVPVVYGRNLFTLMFYGPQGQKQEETIQIPVGGEMVPPGDVYWELAVNEQDRDFIPWGEANRQPAEDDPMEGRRRVVGTAEVGITERLSLGGSFSNIFLEDGEDSRRHRYLSGHLRTTLGDVSVELRGVKDMDGGRAHQVSAFTDLFGIDVYAEHAQYFGFESEKVRPSADPLTRQSQLRLGSDIRFSETFRVPVNVDIGLDRTEAGYTVFDVSTRTSYSSGGLIASNQLSAVRTSGDGTESSTSVGGTFDMNYRFEDTQVRGSVGYSWLPLRRVDSISVSADHDLDEDTNVNAGLSYTLGQNRRATVNAGLSHTFSFAAMNVNGTYGEGGDYGFGLNMSFSLAREPHSGMPVMRSERAANSGAVAARAFLDNDGDGSFTEGDEPLEEVGFEGFGEPGERTNAEGVALLGGVSAGRPTDVVLDEATLEDPFWVAPRPGVSVVGRPGAVAEVDFPVVPTGEIDGTTYLVKPDGERTEVSNTRLELVDAEGRVVATTRSEYDGFFLFDLVPPGTYRLRVEPDQLDRLGLSMDPLPEMDLAASDTLLGLTVTLRPR